MTGHGVRDGERLLPIGLRRPLLALAASSAVLVVTLGVVYHGERAGEGVGGRFDRWVIDALPWTVPVRSSALSSFGALTGMQSAALAAVVLAAVFCALRRWRLAGLAVAGPALTVVTTAAGKHLVSREFYDDPGSLAYPSGHTAGVTSVLLVVALAVLSRVRAQVAAVAALALLVVTAGAATVGLTMVLLNGHYTTDVIGGYCTALAVTLGSAEAVDAVRAPARRHLGVSES
ncbi:phosphatase PAP2 family protein [Geodermatophilus sp. SYSU D01186]